MSSSRKWLRNKNEELDDSKTPYIENSIDASADLKENSLETPLKIDLNAMKKKAKSTMKTNSKTNLEQFKKTI